MMPHCSKLSRLGSPQREERGVSPWEGHREAARCDARPAASSPPAPSYQPRSTTQKTHSGVSPVAADPCDGRVRGWGHISPLACGCQDWVNAVPLDSNAINNGHGQKHLLIDRAFHVVNHGETADGFQKVVLWPAGRATESKGVSSSMDPRTATSQPPSEGHPGGAAASPSLPPHPHAV